MRGNLAQEPLPDILKKLARERRSGILGVSVSEQIRKFIYFERGGIIFASSNDRNDRIGECLMRQGMLLESDFHRASQAMGQGKRFGQILVELGIMNQRELMDAVMVQILDIIFSLFQFSAGPFEFMERENSVPEDLKMNLSTGSIILEGVRRIPDIAVIQRGIGDLNQTFIPGRMPFPGITLLSLKPLERQLTEVITGPTSVMDAVMMTQNPPNLTLKAMYGLISVGLIDRNEVSPVQAAPSPATTQPYPPSVPAQAYQPPPQPPPPIPQPQPAPPVAPVYHAPMVGAVTQPISPPPAVIQPPPQVVQAPPLPVVQPAPVIQAPPSIPVAPSIPVVASPRPIQVAPPPVAVTPPPAPPVPVSAATQDSPSGKLLTAMKERLERAKNPFEILGIQPGTPRFEIRDAYVRLARDFNPERYKNAHPNTRFEVELIFGRIKEAYETLLNAPSGEVQAQTGPLSTSSTGALSLPTGRSTGPLRPPDESRSSGSLNPPSGRATGPLTPPPSSGMTSDPLDAVSGRAPVGSQTVPNPPPPPSGTFNPASGRPTGPLPPPQLLNGTGALPPSPLTGALPTVESASGREQKAEYLFEEAKRKISERDYSGAISCLREAVELVPGSAKYRLVLGTTLSAFPTFIGEAEVQLKRVTQLEPTNITPHIALGQMYLKAGMKPQAEKAFKDALKIDPFSKIAREALGAPEPEKPKGFLDRFFKG